MKACLGIDTSCYTTSVALCRLDTAADGVFFQRRRLLTVEAGARGLMQSEGVFQHTRRLPELISQLMLDCLGMEIEAVCASVRPRPAEESYMPVFCVGEGMARSVAAALRVPFFATTHQQGHVRAARVGTMLDGTKPFVALHLSGGTTEALREEGGAVTLLGGTEDLHAGQFIDRVGVALGLPFPAGPALEKLAETGQDRMQLKAPVTGLTCHFSGAEAQAQRWIAEGDMSQGDIAAEVFGCVARTVAKLILAACETESLSDALLGGGVVSSALIRREVASRVTARNRNIRLHFARPELAGDNAVGVALIGAEQYIRGAEGQI